MNSNQIKALQDYCKKNNISYLGLFGSYAKGLNKSDSDVDLVIRLNRSIGLLEFARIRKELSQVLGKTVDLVTENALNPYLRDEIIKTTKVLYDEAS